MNRVLVIDADREASHILALGCLESGIPVRIAQTLAEGTCCLRDVPIALVVIEAGILRSAGADDVQRLEAAAAGVPLVAALDATATVEEHARLELAGFRVETRPVDVEQVLAKTEMIAREPRAVRRPR